MNSTNAFLKNATYSQPKSTSPDLLEKIRSTKRVEPYNTGKYHPTTYYIILGHGGEDVKKTYKVPKGCILVVKSHSGNVTINLDSSKNIKKILDTENKETVFDPVSHKKELFTLLNSDFQHEFRDITSSNSTAIYREGDTYNNFTYQPVGAYFNISQIRVSGIYKSDNSGESLRNEIDTMIPFDKESKVFLKDATTNICRYNISLDILSLFKYSNAYEYYYTQQHIQDILDIIVEYVNLHKDGYVPLDISETRIIDKYRDKYLKIKKGYIYDPDPNSDTLSPVHIIRNLGLGKECFDSLTHEEYKILEALETKNIKDDPRNKWIPCLQNMTLERLLLIITHMTETSQADLFDDIEKGLIKPGIFYNLVCRSTNNTKEKTFFGNTTNSLLNVKYIEDSNNPIKAHNQVPEIKTRIIEAEHQGRKEQAKAYFNSISETLNNTSRVNKSIDIDPDDIINDYIRYIEYLKREDRYETGKFMIYKTEQKYTNIKFITFKYLLFELQNIKQDLLKLQNIKKDLRNSKNIILEKENIDKIKNINETLSIYYSKKALLAENKEIADMIIKEKNELANDPSKLAFLERKIALNNMFINKYIKPRSSSQPLNDPLNEFVIPEEKEIKILTNTYKKYMNNTDKFYKKANNGHWIEIKNSLNKQRYNNLSKVHRMIESDTKGGKGVTRKQNTRKRKTRKHR